MSHLTMALRAAVATGLMGSFACLGTATATADPTDTLTALLSKGYSSSNCKPAQFEGVAAALDCGQNTDPNGPVSAKYILFNNSSDLASSFTTSVGSMSQGNCGDTKSPTTWHQGSSTDSAGQVACGTYQGQSEILWSTDAKNVLSLIRASSGDTASLYQWWRTNG